MELFRRHYRRRFSKRENAQSWWVYFYFHCLNSAIYCSLHASAPSTCLHMQYIIVVFLSFRYLSPLFWKPKEKIRACSLHSVGSLLCKFWDCSESVERAVSIHQLEDICVFTTNMWGNILFQKSVLFPLQRTFAGRVYQAICWSGIGLASTV